MAKVGIPVKDSTGSVQTMLYENGVATGLQQVVEVYTVSTSIVPGVGATHLGKAEDAVHASGDTGVMMLCVRTDTPATISSATGDYEPPKVNGVGALWVTPTPSTTGGLALIRMISAATTNATLVKASAGQIASIWVSNTASAARYLKLFNMTTAPTVGTSTPVITIAIPAGWTGNLNADYGIAFATGISLAVTTGYLDNDTGVTAAGEVIVNVFYK